MVLINYALIIFLQKPWLKEAGKLIRKMHTHTYIYLFIYVYVCAL